MKKSEAQIRAVSSMIVLSNVISTNHLTIADLIQALRSVVKHKILKDDLDVGHLAVTTAMASIAVSEVEKNG